MDSDLPDCIRYLGYITVNKSMRSLTAEDRAQLAKESINKMCEAKGIRDKKIDNTHQLRVDKMLGSPIEYEHSDDEVELEVSCDQLKLMKKVSCSQLKLINKETRVTIVQHDMPNVSFACIGEQETADYVAYVAKNDELGRACFVLECKHIANIVLNRIAEGFQLPNKHRPLAEEPEFNKRYSSHRMKNYTLKSNNLPDQNYSIEQNNNENIDDLIATTRALLEKEVWFHGASLSRDDSETILKRDGDFLVRESVESGQFVISVMDNGAKLHLLIDSIGQVKTKDAVFHDVTDFVKFHYEKGFPIKRDDRAVYLRNGIRPAIRT